MKTYDTLEILPGFMKMKTKKLQNIIGITLNVMKVNLTLRGKKCQKLNSLPK